MFYANDISRRIKSRYLLKDCQITIQPGRFLAVVGPNGAGKSTLLKILSGESKDFTGTISINGKSISSFKTNDLAQIRSVMPQHTIINFPFTVKQVIEVGRYMHRDRKTDKIIHEILTITDLLPFAERMYQSLSGGEKQRVQMARVMAQIWDQIPDPRYLLLDEPTSSLDISQQQLLLTQAKKLCDRNIGVLAILHDLNLALQYADDILFLKDGHILACGKTEEVVNTAIIEKTFDYPVNLISHEQGITVVPFVKSFQQSILAINQ